MSLIISNQNQTVTEYIKQQSEVRIQLLFIKVVYYILVNPDKIDTTKVVLTVSIIFCFLR
jgi:hypothetical protein